MGIYLTNSDSTYITCGSTVPYSSNLSVFTWIKPHSITADGYKGMVTKGAVFDATYEFAFWMRYRTLSTVGARWRIGAHVHNTGLVGQSRVLTDQSPLNKWQHYGITLDSSTGATVIRVWENGVANAATAFPSFEYGNPFYIGRPETVDGTDDNCPGEYEDVRVYDRVLAENEILTLKSGYRGALGGEIGWWDCMSGKGLTAWSGVTLSTSNEIIDKSENNNVGYPIGSPTAKESNAPRWGVPIFKPLYSFPETYVQSVAGILEFGGELIRGVFRPFMEFAGTLDLSSTFAIIPKINVEGMIEFMGMWNIYNYFKNLYGTITPIGQFLGKLYVRVKGYVTIVMSPDHDIDTTLSPKGTSEVSGLRPSTSL